MSTTTAFDIVRDLDWFKAKLIEAGVAINDIPEEIEIELDCALGPWFDRFISVGLLHIAGEPSKELLKVNAALCEWLSPDPDMTTWPAEQVLIHEIDPTKIVAMLWLRRVTTELIEHLQKKRSRGDSKKTKLLLQLYYLYIDVTGKKALHDGGAAHQFVKTFAAEIDQQVDVPEKGFADLVRKADQRWRAKIVLENEGNFRSENSLEK
jgi:hypothetical protein